VIGRLLPRACFAGALVTAACVSVRALEPNETLRLEPGEALVFGRIRVFENGRELTPWNADLLEELIAPADPEIHLALFRVESEERALYPMIGADGWFTWVPVRHDVLCAFQALAGSEAQYLGELELQVEVERDADLEACGYEIGAVSVRCDPVAARAFLARRGTAVPLQPVERRLETDRTRANRVLASLGFVLLSG
jgi:hypothetical protein